MERIELRRRAGRWHQAQASLPELERQVAELRGDGK